MDTKKFVKAVLLCVMLAVMISLVVDQAHAQGRRNDLNLGGDKDIATKRGFEVFDTGKKADPSRKPNKLQKTVGFASIFVMIAVMKWL